MYHERVINIDQKHFFFFHFKNKCEIAIMLMNEGVSDLKDSK